MAMTGAAEGTGGDGGRRPRLARRWPGVAGRRPWILARRWPKALDFREVADHPKVAGRSDRLRGPFCGGSMPMETGSSNPREVPEERKAIYEQLVRRAGLGSQRSHSDHFVDGRHAARPSEPDRPGGPPEPIDRVKSGFIAAVCYDCDQTACSRVRHYGCEGRDACQCALVQLKLHLHVLFRPGGQDSRIRAEFDAAVRQEQEWRARTR